MPDVRIVKLEKDKEQTLRVRIAPDELNVNLNDKSRVAPVIKLTAQLRAAVQESITSARLAIQREDPIPSIETFPAVALSLPNLPPPKLPSDPIARSLVTVAWDTLTAKYYAICKTFHNSIQCRVQNTKQLLAYRQSMQKTAEELAKKLEHQSLISVDKTFRQQWNRELAELCNQYGYTMDSLDVIARILSDLQDVLMSEEEVPELSRYSERFHAVLVDTHGQRSILLNQILMLQAKRQAALLHGDLSLLPSIDAELKDAIQKLNAFKYEAATEDATLVVAEPQVKPVVKPECKRRIWWDPELQFDKEDDNDDESYTKSNDEKSGGTQLALLAVMKIDLDVRLAAVKAWKEAWLKQCTVKRKALVAKALGRIQQDEEDMLNTGRETLERTLATLDGRFATAKEECFKHWKNQHEVTAMFTDMKFAYDVGLESARDCLYAAGLVSLKQALM